MRYVKMNQFIIANNALLMGTISFLFYRLSDFYFYGVFSKRIHEVRKNRYLKGFCHHVEGNTVNVNENRMYVSRKHIDVSMLTVNVNNNRPYASRKCIDASTFTVNVDRNCIHVNKKCVDVRGKCSFVRKK